MLNIFKTFVCQRRNSHMFSWCNIKMAFCSDVTNRVAAIILRTINHTQARLFRKPIFKWKLLKILDGASKKNFNKQYSKVLSITFDSSFLISNYLLLRIGKKQTNFFFGTIDIFECLINTLSKYIWMQRSTKVLGYPFFRKLCFTIRISKCRVL